MLLLVEFCKLQQNTLMPLASLQGHARFCGTYAPCLKGLVFHDQCMLISSTVTNLQGW